MAEQRAPSWAWSEYTTPEAIDRTIKLILRPQSLITRATERLEVVDDYISRHVTLELVSGPIPHLIPIAQPLRGSLIDVIKIDASTTVPGFLVGRWDTFAITETMLEYALGSTGNIDMASRWVKLATQVASSSPADSRILATILRRLQAASDAPGTLVAAHPELEMMARNASFYRLFRFFKQYRTLLAPCRPSSEAFVVSYSYELGLREFRRGSAVELARSALGMAPYNYLLETQLALRASTYHLRMRAPTNHYVRYCKPFSTTILEQTDKAGRSRRVGVLEFEPSAPAFAQYADRDADGLAHVYFGDLNRDTHSPRRIFVRLKLSERPMGQVGAAFVRLAVVLATLVYMRVSGRSLISAKTTLGVSILLALPGILGISAILSAPLGTIRAPLAARVASVGSAALAIAASFAFLSWSAHAGNCQPHPGRPCTGAAPANVSSALNVIGGIALLGLVVTGLQLSSNLWLYLRAKRSGPRRSRNEPLPKGGA